MLVSWRCLTRSIARSSTIGSVLSEHRTYSGMEKDCGCTDLVGPPKVVHIVVSHKLEHCSYLLAERPYVAFQKPLYVDKTRWCSGITDLGSQAIASTKPPYAMLKG
jgi:hypothetical protein